LFAERWPDPIDTRRPPTFLTRNVPPRIGPVNVTFTTRNEVDATEPAAGLVDLTSTWARAGWTAAPKTVPAVITSRVERCTRKSWPPFVRAAVAAAPMLYGVS
jgi:hypothetical protein